MSNEKKLEIGSRIRFKQKYEFYPNDLGSQRHIWSVECAQGAVHLHINVYSIEADPSGGIEIHFRQPPKYRMNDAPDHQKCYFTGGLCWHDGSSMGAEDAISMFLRCQQSGNGLKHDWFFGECTNWVRDHLLARLQECEE